jgi:hypothetical protein
MMFTILRSHRRPAIAATCLAVIVSGCGAGGQSSPTAAQRHPALGADGGATLASSQRTGSASQRSTAPASTPLSAVAAGEVLRVLAGDGNARLGSLSERRPVVVEWRSTHPVQIFTARGFLLLASPSPHGRIRLSGGTYRGLRIATAGRWRIALRSNR